MPHPLRIAVPLLALLALPAAATGQAAPVASQADAVPLEADGMEEAEFNAPLPWPDYLPTDPEPGLYRMTAKLTRMSVNGESISDGVELRDMMGAGFAEEANLCLTSDDPRRSEWLADLAQVGCTVAEPQISGDAFTQVLQCLDTQTGESSRLVLAGQAYPDRAVMNVNILMEEEEADRFEMDLRVIANRIGDCP